MFSNLLYFLSPSQFNPLTVTVPTTGEMFNLTHQMDMLAVQPSLDLLSGVIRVRDYAAVSRSVAGSFIKQDDGNKNRIYGWEREKQWEHCEDVPGKTVLYCRRREVESEKSTDDKVTGESDPHALSYVFGMVLVKSCRLYQMVKMEMVDGQAKLWHMAPDLVPGWTVDLALLRSPEDVLAPNLMMPIEQNMRIQSYFPALLSLIEAEASWSVLETRAWQLRFTKVDVSHSDTKQGTITLIGPKYGVIFPCERDWVFVRLRRAGQPEVMFQGMCIVKTEEQDKTRAGRKKRKNQKDRRVVLEWPDGCTRPPPGTYEAWVRLLQLNQTARHWFDAQAVGEYIAEASFSGKLSVPDCVDPAVTLSMAIASGPTAVEKKLHVLPAWDREMWPSQAEEVWQAVFDGGVADATLNDDQAEAIARMLGQPFTMVHGPAGTGKTMTAVMMMLVSFWEMW